MNGITSTLEEIKVVGDRSAEELAMINNIQFYLENQHFLLVNFKTREIAMDIPLGKIRTTSNSIGTSATH
jgi:hypothetical protein